MRGKVLPLLTKTSFPGITPAYAGKRQMTAGCSAAVEDHPRLCGEKVDFVHFCTSAVGSPPPMRGKVIFCKLLNIVNRITPAYAGKSKLLEVETTSM